MKFPVVLVILTLLATTAQFGVNKYRKGDDTKTVQGITYKLSDGSLVMLNDEGHAYLGRKYGDRLPSGLEIVDAIIVGETISSKVAKGFYVESGEESVFTYHTVRVHRFIKPFGATQKEIIIKTPGGCMGTSCMYINSTREVPKKGKFVAFLEKVHDGYVLGDDVLSPHFFLDANSASVSGKIVETSNIDSDTRSWLQNAACPNQTVLSQYLVKNGDMITMKGDYVDERRATWTARGYSYQITCTELNAKECSIFSKNIFFNTPELQCDDLVKKFVCKEEKSMTKKGETHPVFASSYFDFDDVSEGRAVQNFLLIVKLENGTPVVANTICPVPQML